MCLHSWAAVTPVKYESDIICVTRALIIMENQENNGTEKVALVTPTPDRICIHIEGPRIHIEAGKMAAILQKTLSNAFSWMKLLNFK